MKTRQLLASVLASALLVAAAAGCGDGGSAAAESSEPQAVQSGAADGQTDLDNVNEEGYPVVKEAITVTMMGQKAGIHGDWDKMEFFEIMRDMTGIDFEFDTPASEVLEEKKNLALNSGNYAEVLFGTNLTRDQQVKYGSQGILLPL